MRRTASSIACTLALFLQVTCSENSQPAGERNAATAGASTTNGGVTSNEAGKPPDTDERGGTATAGSGGGGAPSMGGTAGALQDGKLGSTCNADADCGQGFVCLSATSGLLGSGSPARGLCAKPCKQGESSCENASPGAACVYFDDQHAFCLEGCVPGAGSQVKCHGRADLACATVYDADTAPVACDSGQTCQPGFDCIQGYCFAKSSACLPQCNADSDCSSGQHCDHHSAFDALGALCRAAPAPGAATGATCTGADDRSCRGACLDLDGGFACADGCTLGADNACGSSAGGKISEACLYAFGSADADGDAAACIKLCDCDVDCGTPGLHCHTFSADSPSRQLGRTGYCDFSMSSLGCP
jgi:hypothetical protein